MNDKTIFTEKINLTAVVISSMENISDDESSHVEAHWEGDVLSASITTADDTIVLEVSILGFNK